MRSRAFLALLAGLLLGLAPAASSAAPVDAPGEPLQASVLEVNQSRYPEVQIRFQLRNPGGELVPLDAIREVQVVEGLAGGNQFQVARVRVEPLGHQPVRALFLVDASGSMEGQVGPAGESKMDAMKRALNSLLDRLQAGDQFALMSYNLEAGSYVDRGDRPGATVRDHFDWLTGEGYATDRGAMREAVNRLEVSRDYTPYTDLFNAVAAAVEWDQQRRKPGDPVSQIVVMTDGMDNRADIAARVVASGNLGLARAMGDSLEAEQVAARAREAGVIVHALGFGNRAAPPLTDLDALRPDQLERLAEGARGSFLLAPDPDSLEQLYSRMAADLRAGQSAVYTVPRSYWPGPDGTPQPRTLELRVLAGGRWVSAPLQRYTPAGVVGLPPAGGEESDRQQWQLGLLMAAFNLGLLLVAVLARGASGLLSRRFLAQHRRMARLRFTPELGGLEAGRRAATGDNLRWNGSNPWPTEREEG